MMPKYSVGIGIITFGILFQHCAKQTPTFKDTKRRRLLQVQFPANDVKKLHQTLTRSKKLTPCVFYSPIKDLTQDKCQSQGEGLRGRGFHPLSYTGEEVLSILIIKCYNTSIKINILRSEGQCRVYKRPF